MDPRLRNVLIVAALVAVGYLLYTYVLKDQLGGACSSHETQEACALPCKWDEYFEGEDGEKGRCVDKDTPLTLLATQPVGELSPPTDASPAPSVDISNISGMTGRYTAESYSTSQKLWKDESGNTNDFRVQGNLSVSDDKTYVYGGVEEKFTLPDDLFDRQYTLFILSKYNGDGKRRILTSSEGGWFSGHNAGKSGVAYHDNWITQDSNKYGDNWVLSTDQRNLYRANGRRLSGYGLDESFPKDVGVNITSGQESDFAIAEIIVYNKELTEEEYTKVEQMLMEKYSVSPKRFMRSGMFTSYGNDLYNTQMDCGPTSGLSGFQLATSDNKSRYEYNCMFNLDQSGQTMDLTTEYKSKTDNFYDAILDETLDCGTRPIETYKFGVKNSNETQVQYRCSDAEVDEQSCRDVTSSDQDINNLTAHDIQCENNEVMTYLKFQKSENNPDKTRYVYKCCKPKGY